MSTPSWNTGSLTFVTSGSNWEASSFTKACYHHWRCSSWGAGRPWHGETLHVISVIVPTAWSQGGRLSQQFLWCGQVPTTTPALCLFKWLLLLWDQWPGEKLDWTLELDYFTSRQRMRKMFPCSFNCCFWIPTKQKRQTSCLRRQKFICLMIFKRCCGKNGSSILSWDSKN